MTNRGVAGFPSAPNADPRLLGIFTSGGYYFTSSPHTSSTSATLGVATLRLAPWPVPQALMLSRIGGEVTSNGESGSLFRLGIYADNGYGYPGALVLDAGTIAGDSSTVQEINIALALAAGIYWIGGAVQNVVTTQPTMRINNQWAAPIPLRFSAAPSANASATGYQQTSVTGALPAVFTSTVSTGGSVARVHVRVA